MPRCEPSGLGAADWRGAARGSSSGSLTGSQPALDELGVARHRETEDPIDEAGKHIAGRRRVGGGPVSIGEIELDDAQEIEQADDEDEAGVLEEGNVAVDDPR